MKKILSMMAVLALVITGLVIGASGASAHGHGHGKSHGHHKKDDSSHKSWICHPVNGKGSTGYGWTLVHPDNHSAHIRNGVPRHTSKDGRTDVYLVGGHCPGVPTPTTTAPSPTQTSTPSSTTTPPVTETTPPVTETTPSVTKTTPSVTQTTPSVTTTTPSVTKTTPSTTETTTTSATVVPSTSYPPTIGTATAATRSEVPVVRTANVLPRTGTNAWLLVGIGFALILAGGVLLYGRGLDRKH